MALGTVNLKEALRESLKNATSLDLSYRKLHALPEEAAAILRPQTFQEIDLTGNKLVTVPDAAFPLALRVLRLTGNEFERPPRDILKYKGLQEVYLGCNRLTDAVWVFKCRALLHAGLPYNSIPSIPSKLPYSDLRLMSLDLSHNNILDLEGTLVTLTQLPKLRNLVLQGNPICLLPYYHKRVKAALPDVEFFDGKNIKPKEDAIAQARLRAKEAEEAEMNPQVHAPKEDATVEAVVDEQASVVYFKMEIVEIVPVVPQDLQPNPEAELEVAAEREKAKAKEKPKKGEEVEDEPKTTFHIEYCFGNNQQESPTMSIITEEVLPIDTKPATGKKGQEEEPPPPVFPHQQYLMLPYGLELRDFLRTGMNCYLVRIDPPPKSESAADEVPTSVPKDKAKKPVPESVKEVDNDVDMMAPPEPVRTELGKAVMNLGAFLDGDTRVIPATLDFLVPPRVLDDKGHLMSLHEQHPPSVGTATVRLFIHEKEPPPPPEEEEEVPDDGKSKKPVTPAKPGSRGGKKK